MLSLSVSSLQLSKANISFYLNKFSDQISNIKSNIRIQIVKMIFDEIRPLLENDNLKFKHLREIHPLHTKLTNITEGVLQEDSAKESWKNILMTIQNKLIYNVGFGYSYLDCSREMDILKGKSISKISILTLDSSNAKELDKAVDTMVELDAESLGAYVSKGFYKTLLKTAKTACFLAKTDEGHIIGFCWGSYTYIRDRSIFHIWGLARSAKYSGLNVTKLFLDHINPFLRQKFNPDYITFRLLKDNEKAIEVYKKLGFNIPLDEPQVEDTNNKAAVANKPVEDSVRVIHPFSQFSKNDKERPTSEEVYQAMKKFVIENVGYANTAYYEGIRVMNIKFKQLYYR